MGKRFRIFFWNLYSNYFYLGIFDKIIKNTIYFDIISSTIIMLFTKKSFFFEKSLCLFFITINFLVLNDLFFCAICFNFGFSIYLDINFSLWLFLAELWCFFCGWGFIYQLLFLLRNLFFMNKKTIIYIFMFLI